MQLKGRVALVTGGGRGIGRAIALALAEDGADVAISYRRDAAAAGETCEALRALGRRALSHAAAMDDEDALSAMVDAAGRELGPVDLLVNNAGIASRGDTVARTDPAELARVIRVHALAPHRLCQLVLPQMKQKPRGDIVMISSVATLSHAAGGAPYNMGKAALEALAFTLAKEVRKHGIRVNVVAPGLVETEMGRRLVRATSGVEDLRQLDPLMPFGRVCQPQDVANVVRFLVSGGGGYVTGEKINVWGGGSAGSSGWL
ncbi:MAG: SDR family oxidoreductase [Deltaproteobacteria bacterium]|nr:SDR family oxidoreductase [Deltaproteobacteria bacterium]